MHRTVGSWGCGQSIIDYTVFVSSASLCWLLACAFYPCLYIACLSICSSGCCLFVWIQDPLPFPFPSPHFPSLTCLIVRPLLRLELTVCHDGSDSNLRPPCLLLASLFFIPLLYLSVSFLSLSFLSGFWSLFSCLKSGRSVFIWSH